MYMDSMTLQKDRLDAVRSLMRARNVLVERVEAALAADEKAPSITRMWELKAGLVERQECPSDRRGHLIALTPAGRRTLELMRPVYDRALGEAFASVSDEDAAMLSSVLDPVMASACAAVGDEDALVASDGHQPSR